MQKGSLSDSVPGIHYEDSYTAMGIAGWNARLPYCKGEMGDEGMSEGSTGSISVDEFQALEAKVLQTVELIRREREARAAAEAERNAAQAEIAVLQERLRSLEEANSTAHTELETYHHERDLVRGRVEKLLAQMDELL